jgi:nitroreductase
MENKVIDALNFRYATKKFNPDRLLTDDQVETLIEAVRLTPTSYGLQLMKLVVVENKDLRDQLLPHAFAQNQVVDASHLFILCREKEIFDQHIHAYVENMATQRAVEIDTLEGFRSMMLRSVAAMSQEKREVWMNNQVYIALGNLLSACAMLGIDATPMEGFKPKEFDAVLGLNELNLSSVLCVPVGYRADDDANAFRKKIRRSKESFLVKI